MNRALVGLGRTAGKFAAFLPKWSAVRFAFVLGAFCGAQFMFGFFLLLNYAQRPTLLVLLSLRQWGSPL